MLKKRVIPVLLLQDGRLVKGKKFTNLIDTGDPKSAIRVYSAQDADELIFLDIEKRKGSNSDLNNLIMVLERASEECYMPLTVGGGIRKFEQACELFRVGADKVVLTTGSVTNPEVIKKVVRTYGSQSIIGGVDYKIERDIRKVWINCGSEETNLSITDHVDNLINMGVGEIFINSIDNDGMMSGYDLKFAINLASKITVPLIVCGGAGNFLHLKELLDSKVSGACCASLFHFGDNNPIRARSYLKNNNIPMRILK